MRTLRCHFKHHVNLSPVHTGNVGAISPDAAGQSALAQPRSNNFMPSGHASGMP